MTNEKLKTFCMNLPGATEGIKWEEHICYMVGSKIFCMTSLQDGSPINFKVSDEEFEEMSERDGIIQAPYMARNKWVQVQQRNKLRPKEWEHYLKQSYELIKSKLTKKQQKEIDEMGA
jgi:predicted DNA-binding protein (MmcQ/YjbR family)